MHLTRLVFLAISITLASCRAPNNSRILRERLYNDVTTSDYDDAIETLMELHRRGHAEVIKQALTLLLENAKSNPMEFAYKLWQDGKSDIVNKYFPEAFQFIFEGKSVKLIFNKNQLALTLGTNPDSAGDNTAFGVIDQTSNGAWKLSPFWDNEEDKLYFKIVNVGNNQFLKLGVAKDSFDEHQAYGGDSATDFRHDWYLRPVKFERRIDLFFIYNREFEQGLKIRPDSHNTATSNQNEVFREADVYGWAIVPQ